MANQHSFFNPLFIRDVLRAVRIQNLIILVFAQYFAAFFLGANSESLAHVVTDPRMFLLSLSTVLIAAAGYIINDYYDIKIDLINNPDRVIVGKNVSRRIAIFLHSSFSFIGVATGIYLSLYIGIINFVSAFLLWWYSNYVKMLPFLGNFLIGILSGTAILLVAFIFPESTFEIVIYGFFAGSFTLIREIIKDIEDLAGDERFGYKTLPVVWGIRKTKQILFLLIILFALFTLYLTFREYRTKWIELNVGLFLLSTIFIYKLVKADKKKDFSWLSLYCKVILILGVLSMVYVSNSMPF